MDKRTKISNSDACSFPYDIDAYSQGKATSSVYDLILLTADKDFEYLDKEYL